MFKKCIKIFLLPLLLLLSNFSNEANEILIRCYIFFQMTKYKTENPWNIQSIYDLQYFGCPSCKYSNNSKQHFVNHAYESHPDCIDYLLNIKDGSFDDILCPWESVDIKLEKQLSMELTEDSYEDQHNESFDLEFAEHNDESDIKDIKPEEHFTMELTEDSLKTGNQSRI